MTILQVSAYRGPLSRGLKLIEMEVHNDKIKHNFYVKQRTYAYQTMKIKN